jgi:hypothetical protein
MGETERDRPSLDENTRGLCEYTDSTDSQPPGLPLRCPSCGCRTLGERDGFEICPVCFWEDDGQDDHDADVVRGGPQRFAESNPGAGQLLAVRSLRKMHGGQRASTSPG